MEGRREHEAEFFDSERDGDARDGEADLRERAGGGGSGEGEAAAAAAGGGGGGGGAGMDDGRCES
jgi:hypothetical protein